MKKFYALWVPAAVFCVVLAGAGLVAFADEEADAEADAKTSNAVIETEKDKVSYAIGVQIGGSILQGGIDVDSDVLVDGIKDVLAQNELAMSETEMQQAMMKLQQRMQEQQQEQTEQLTPEQREQLQQQMQQQMQQQQMQ